MNDIGIGMATSDLTIQKEDHLLPDYSELGVPETTESKIVAKAGDYVYNLLISYVHYLLSA